MTHRVYYVASAAARSAWATALLLSGCFQSNGPIPVDQFGERMADVLCARAFECCDNAERESYVHRENPDREECHAYIAGVWTLFGAEEAISEGRVRYEADTARECVDYLATRGCAVFDRDVRNSADSPCGRIFVPLVELGGTCRGTGDFEECVGGTCIGGRCVATAADGEACDARPCRRRSSCDEGICVSYGDDLGEECTGSFECTTFHCDLTGHCAPEEPFCAAPLPDGPEGPSDGFLALQAAAVCERMFACCDLTEAEELFGSRLFSESGCVLAWTDRMANASERRSLSIRAGRARWEQGLADECLSYLDSLECSDLQEFFRLPDACDRLSTPLLRVGEGPCRYPEYECETGYCVDGLCADAPGIGAPCDTVCSGDGLTCTGTCTPLAAIDERCTHWSECRSGNCDDGLCGPLTAACTP